jgi:uncharacterized protein HemX
MTIPTPKSENIEAFGKLPTITLMVILVAGLGWVVWDGNKQEQLQRNEQLALQREEANERAEIERQRTHRMMTVLENLINRAIDQASECEASRRDVQPQSVPQGRTPEPAPTTFSGWDGLDQGYVRETDQKVFSGGIKLP